MDKVYIILKQEIEFVIIAAVCEVIVNVGIGVAR